MMKITYEMTPSEFMAVHNEVMMLNAKLAAMSAPVPVMEEPEPEPTIMETVIGGLEGPEASLTLAQLEAWQYLKDRSDDCPKGVTVTAVAAHLGIKASAANQRLRSLQKMGYAKRLSRGYYLASVPTRKLNGHRVMASARR